MTLALIILLVLIGLLVANAITLLLVHALTPDPFDDVEKAGLLLAYIAFPLWLIGTPWRVYHAILRHRAR